MRLRDLRTPLWLLGLLGVLEVGLELRAHRRGWETLLFGASAMHVEQGEARYGPREGYPFWGPVVSKARTPGVPRIWVASTSHAAPMDQPKDRIFPTRMRARCEALGRPCEVLNASEPGLVIEENIRALEALAPAWRPDVAVLYSMSNDITALSSRYLGGGGRPRGGRGRGGGGHRAAPAAELARAHR